MKGVFVYLKLEKCVAQWCQYKMGNPIRFIKKSHLSAMLVQLRTKWPEGQLPQVRPHEGEVTTWFPMIHIGQPKRIATYQTMHATNLLWLLQTFSS